VVLDAKVIHYTAQVAVVLVTLLISAMQQLMQKEFTITKASATGMMTQ
jgi:hypothetical protein